MAKKRSFRRHLRLIAAGSAVDVLEYPEEHPVRRGERHHVTLTAYEESANAPTSVQIMVRRGGIDFFYYEKATPTAGIVYVSDDEYILTEGERLRIYFNGATATNVCDVYLQGWWIEE